MTNPKQPEWMEEFEKFLAKHDYNNALNFRKNSIKTFFGERTCKGRIYGGDEECFNKHYKIVDPLPPKK